MFAWSKIQQIYYRISNFLVWKAGSSRVWQYDRQREIFILTCIHKYHIQMAVWTWRSPTKAQSHPCGSSAYLSMLMITPVCIIHCNSSVDQIADRINRVNLAARQFTGYGLYG